MARRIRIYMFGVLLGVIMVYLMFLRDPDRDLDKWTMDQRVLEEIRYDSTLMQRDRVHCFLKCVDVSEKEFLQLLLDGNVVFSKSQTRDNPRVYHIEYTTKSGRALESKFELGDKRAGLKSLSEVGKSQDCEC